MLKVLLFSSLVFAAPTQKAHVHGAGHVSMAFDGKRGKIEMELPGDTFFGFEHEARSKKDKAAKDKALKTLDDNISNIIVFDPSLKCEIKKDMVEVNQEKDHSDVSVEFSVVCQTAVGGTSVSFNFQKHFARLKKVQVDVIAEGVQKSLEVTKNGDSIELK